MRKWTCKHFNGFYGPGMKVKQCDNGIEYRSLVGGKDNGWIIRTPCFEKHETTVKCESYTEPTESDLEQFAKEDNIFQKKLNKQIAFTFEIKKQNNWGGSGKDKCPLCGGVINWSISSFNGHVRLKCETDGCTNIME